MFDIVWLPANQAFVILFGDGYPLSTRSLLPIDERTFFPTRAEAELAFTAKVGKSTSDASRLMDAERYS